jgi:hypothetical protein
MPVVTVTPSSDRWGYFAATSSDGRTIVQRSRVPLLDASRALLTSANSTHAIGMVHMGSSVIALTGILSICAGLEVIETGTAPVFRRYQGRHSDRTSVISSSE